MKEWGRCGPSASEADQAKMTRQKRLNVIITTFADSIMTIGDDIRIVEVK
jgi:hypothetical protein